MSFQNNRLYSQVIPAVLLTLVISALILLPGCRIRAEEWDSWEEQESDQDDSFPEEIVDYYEYSWPESSLDFDVQPEEPAAASDHAAASQETAAAAATSEPAATPSEPAAAPAAAPAATPAPTVLIPAPYISQSQNWVTGCESVSATMLLQYLGMDISVDKFIYGYLDMKPMTAGPGGEIYGPNPNQYFAGSPYTENSYGCYAKVIQRALQNALDQYGNQIGDSFEVVDLTGVSMEEICAEYLDAGLPVVFWATMGMIPSVIGPSWVVPDTGEKFSWLQHEHCMLLVGYDDANYYFNDPYNNHGTIPYEKNLTMQRHQEQYSMAVGVVPHAG